MFTEEEIEILKQSEYEFKPIVSSQYPFKEGYVGYDADGVQYCIRKIQNKFELNITHFYEYLDEGDIDEQYSYHSNTDETLSAFLNRV